MWLSQRKIVPKIYSCKAIIADVNPFSLMNISHYMDTQYLFEAFIYFQFGDTVNSFLWAHT